MVSKKGIVTGTRNGTVYAYDVNDNGVIAEKWKYIIAQKFSPLAEINDTKFNGGTVITDMDLDGSNEVIFADVSNSLTDVNFPGEVYVLYGNNGTNKTSYIFKESGAYGSVSAANLDSDDNPEILTFKNFKGGEL